MTKYVDKAIFNLKYLAVRVMRWKLFVEFCLTILVLFVVAGDILLPQPYRAESQQLKTNINHFLVGLLPQQKIFEIKTKEEKSLDL